VIAAAVPELRDACVPQRLLNVGKVARSKLDPCPAIGVLVVNDPRRGWGEFRELDAERAPILEAHEQDRVLQPEVALEHLAVKDIPEQGSERGTMIRAHEQVDSRAQAHESRPALSHRAYSLKRSSFQGSASLW
jgi:hypothetical protein